MCIYIYIYIIIECIRILARPFPPTADAPVPPARCQTVTIDCASRPCDRIRDGDASEFPEVVVI